MIRKTTVDKNILDLEGPDDNAHVLLGLASRLCSEIGFGSDMKESILAEMRSGDYKNLVKTFDEHFGSIVVLETTNEELLNA